MPQSDPEAAQIDPDGRLRTLVGVVMGVLIVLIIALVSYDFWNRRTQTIDDAFRRAGNLAHILAQHLDRSFNAVDATLGHLASQSQRLGGPRATTTSGARSSRPRVPVSPISARSPWSMRKGSCAIRRWPSLSDSHAPISSSSAPCRRVGPM